MDRRGFLKGVSTLAVSNALLSPFRKQAWASPILHPGRTPLSILQGLTTETSTQVTVDLPHQTKAVYILTDTETKRRVEPTWVRESRYGTSPYRVDRINFENLELGHIYSLLVQDKDTNQSLDERFLHTVDLLKPNARVAVISCMSDSKPAKLEMWPSVAAANLDYIFFIGDSVYGDTFTQHGPALLWSRFIESRANIPFYQWKKLVPVLAVWDDHDYGKNNANGTYEHKVTNLEIFKSFYGQESVGQIFETGPGLSSCFRAFHQTFLFLDSRYFRSLPYQGIKGFLGAEQMTWANEMMKSSSGPVWVLEGSPFFGRAEKANTSYQAESPAELEVFLKHIRGWSSPACFFGGDIHYGEISKMDSKYVGYPTYEFISSCLHSSTKQAFLSNPNPRVHGTLKENFFFFEKSGLLGDATWKVTCAGANSQTSYSAELAIG